MMPPESPYLLDTGALIDMYRGRERIRPYFDALSTAGAYVSVISEAELWRGLRPGEVAAHEALLNYFTSLPLTSAIARTAGRWMQQFESRGLGWMDALLVATAQQAGLPVLTRDKRLAAVLAGQVTFILYE